MRQVPSFVLATTTVVLLLGAGQARAGFVTFSYSWSVSPGAVLPSGTGSVSLALAGPGSPTVETGLTTAIVAATVTTTSSATTTADTFNVPFSLELHLTDNASGDLADLSFSGTVAGTLTATSAELTSTFHDPITYVRTLGDYLYTVTIDPVVANLPAPGGAQVLLDALILVTPASTQQETPGPSPTERTPEPSTLLLGASGLSLLWLARRRAALAC